MERETVPKEAWLPHLLRVIAGQTRPLFSQLSQGHGRSITHSTYLLLQEQNWLGVLSPWYTIRFNQRVHLSALLLPVWLFCDPEKICSLWLNDLSSYIELCGTEKGSLPFPRCPPILGRRRQKFLLDPVQRSPQSCHYTPSGSVAPCL